MNNSPINDLLLERYILNELPKEKMMEISERIKQDPRLSEKINRLNQSDTDILNQYPAEKFVPQILERCREAEETALVQREREKPSFIKNIQAAWKRPLIFAVPAMAVALLIILVLDPFSTDNIDIATPIRDPRFVQDTTRLKGGIGFDLKKTNLIIYRQLGNGVEILENQAKAKQGDLIQVAYTPGPMKYGVILSIDGRSNVTLHVPSSRTGSSLLETKGKILLENSYQLDAAPVYERFFFITSTSPIDVKTVMKKAKTLAQDTRRSRSSNLAINSSFKQISFTLLK